MIPDPYILHEPGSEQPILTPERRAEIIAAADATAHGKWSSQWLLAAFDAVTKEEREALEDLFYKSPGGRFSAIFRQELERRTF